MSAAAKLAAKESMRRDALRDNARSGDPFRVMIPIRLEYQLPPVSPLTDRDHWRLTNSDLDAMTRGQLEDEALRLRITLAFGDLRSPVWATDWIEGRMERCAELLRKK